MLCNKVRTKSQKEDSKRDTINKKEKEKGRTFAVAENV